MRLLASFAQLAAICSAIPVLLAAEASAKGHHDLANRRAIGAASDPWCTSWSAACNNVCLKGQSGKVKIVVACTANDDGSYDFGCSCDGTSNTAKALKIVKQPPSVTVTVTQSSTVRVQQSTTQFATTRVGTLTVSGSTTLKVAAPPTLTISSTSVSVITTRPVKSVTTSIRYTSIVTPSASVTVTKPTAYVTEYTPVFFEEYATQPAFNDDSGSSSSGSGEDSSSGYGSGSGSSSSGSDDGSGYDSGSGEGSDSSASDDSGSGDDSGSDYDYNYGDCDEYSCKRHMQMEVSLRNFKRGGDDFCSQFTSECTSECNGKPRILICTDVAPSKSSTEKYSVGCTCKKTSQSITSDVLAALLPDPVIVKATSRLTKFSTSTTTLLQTLSVPATTQTQFQTFTTTTGKPLTTVVSRTTTTRITTTGSVYITTTISDLSSTTTTAKATKTKTFTVSPTATVYTSTTYEVLAPTGYIRLDAFDEDGSNPSYAVVEDDGSLGITSDSDRTPWGLVLQPDDGSGRDSYALADMSGEVDGSFFTFASGKSKALNCDTPSFAFDAAPGYSFAAISFYLEDQASSPNADWQQQLTPATYTYGGNDYTPFLYLDGDNGSILVANDEDCVDSATDITPFFEPAGSADGSGSDSGSSGSGSDSGSSGSGSGSGSYDSSYDDSYGSY